jgi:hypothetical protein
MDAEAFGRFEEKGYAAIYGGPGDDLRDIRDSFV